MARPYNCTEEVATILTQICCHENQLPQGAPTSPIISNMLCAKLDSQLQRLARKYQCIYTRYADDITFSTSRPRFPPHLMWFSKEADKPILGDELKHIIEEYGFLVNETKVRLQNRYKRQEVTGITVNEKLNVNRKYIRQIRAVLHAWEKYGLRDAASEFWKQYKEHRHYQENPNSFKNIVRGRIEFIGSVRGKDDQIYLSFLRLLQKLAPELVDSSKLNFANARNSFINPNISLPLATIWTEGKTDVKHLRSALRWLDNRNITYKFKLNFKEDLPTQSSSELLGICKTYCKDKRSEPMIAIFDRDEPKFINEAHDDARGFKDWGNGVYSFVIPIPQHRIGVTGICIEHYYKDEEIQKEDKDNRRIFLSTEFNYRSGRHLELDLNIIDKNKIKSDQLKIVDSDVFDRYHNNVALSKNNFAGYIFEGVEGFNEFGFSEFQKIFEIVDKILQYHVELSAAKTI